MNFRKRIYAPALFSLGLTAMFAQDSQFRNPNLHLTDINPSFAGLNGGLRNQAALRSQWYRLSGGFSQFRNSVDFKVPGLNGGASLSYYQEQLGPVQTSGYSVSYGHQIRPGKAPFILIPSVQGTVFDTQIYDEWISPFPNPPVKNADRSTYLSLSTGMLAVFDNNLTLGTYFFHVNSPDVGRPWNSKLPTRAVVHASYTFLKGDRHMLQVFGLASKQQNNFSAQVALNALFHRHFLFGAGYRVNDNLIVNGGFHHRNFNVLLSYDVSVSHYASNALGSWELGTSFSLFRPTRDVVVPFERM